jgi:hypothetical protein
MSFVDLEPLLQFSYDCLLIIIMYNIYMICKLNFKQIKNFFKS